MAGYGVLRSPLVGGALSSAGGLKAPYGVREDFTPKGFGFMGALSRPDGQTSTELSFDFEHGGKRIFAPLLVPTLSHEQIQHLLNDGRPTPEIYDVAQRYALERIGRGMSPFARNSETPPSWK
jgi:hypothetical protein